MKEFFKGWRRKIGVLTLLMACVFAAGWVRGFIRGELVNLPNQLAIVTDRQTLSLVKPRNMPPDWGITSFSSQYRVWNRMELVPILVVPYWSIVIPLTLLSAYLLPSKPWTSTPNKFTEPIPTEGP